MTQIINLPNTVPDLIEDQDIQHFSEWSFSSTSTDDPILSLPPEWYHHTAGDKPVFPYSSTSKSIGVGLCEEYSLAEELEGPYASSLHTQGSQVGQFQDKVPQSVNDMQGQLEPWSQPKKSQDWGHEQQLLRWEQKFTKLLQDQNRRFNHFMENLNRSTPHHPSYSSNIVMLFECGICKKSYDTQSELDQHRKEAHRKLACGAW